MYPHHYQKIYHSVQLKMKGSDEVGIIIMNSNPRYIQQH